MIARSHQELEEMRKGSLLGPLEEAWPFDTSEIGGFTSQNN